jgi:hypothetical protein
VFPNRAPGVTAVTANTPENMTVGWLTQVLAPGVGYGGRKLRGDDTVDKGLGVIFGAALGGPVTAPGLVTDNVDNTNPAPLNTFPYFPANTGTPPPPPAGSTVFATAYINPDIGLATANPTVMANSECATPDREDTQQVSAAGSTANNVHVDACLSTAALGAGTRLDMTASFEVSGVGTISACPDPDGTGPKTATLTGNRCTLTGFEAANREYHVRVNSTVPGDQMVIFCSDPEGNGCADASAQARSQQVVVRWVQQ